jgi:Coenzyme PQQ synthesis protein D (PqqD)
MVDNPLWKICERASTIREATIVSRNPSVLTADVDGEVVMMSIEQGRCLGLDKIGSDIWKRIEPPCSFATLIEGLAADYEADRATIIVDVENLLLRMVEQDVARLTEV